MVDQLDAAISLFESSLKSAEERHDGVEAIRFAVLLANTLIDKTEFDAAEHLLARILELTDSNDPVVRARLYWSQSRLAAAQEDHHRAARYARHALDLLELTEQTYYTAQAHQLLAHIELDRQQPRDALDLLERGLDLLADTGTPTDVALFRLEEARALIQLDQPEEAAVAGAGGDRSARGRQPIRRGARLRRRRGRLCGARRHAEGDRGLRARRGADVVASEPVPDGDVRETRRAARGLRPQGRGARGAQEGRRHPGRSRRRNR
jgi:ATP/maltotriose-dependent transcriptional regulator MalT